MLAMFAEAAAAVAPAAAATDWTSIITSLSGSGLAIAILWYLLRTVIPKMQERHSIESERQRGDFKDSLGVLVADAKEARDGFQAELAAQREARIESTKTEAASASTLARLCDAVEKLDDTMKKRVRQATVPSKPVRDGDRAATRRAPRSVD